MEILYGVRLYEKTDDMEGLSSNRKKRVSRLILVFGLIAEGLFKSGDEIAASSARFQSLQIGDVKYANINNDHHINKRTICCQ